MTDNSSASTSHVPNTTDSSNLVPDVNHTSVNAPLSVEVHFPAFDCLDVVGGSHTDSGGPTNSASHIQDPLPLVPDVNHMSVDDLTTVEDIFHASELLDTAGGSHIDSVNQTWPPDEPYVHFLADDPHGGDSHADDLNIDLDGEFLFRYLSPLLNVFSHCISR